MHRAEPYGPARRPLVKGSGILTRSRHSVKSSRVGSRARVRSGPKATPSWRGPPNDNDRGRGRQGACRAQNVPRVARSLTACLLIVFGRVRRTTRRERGQLSLGHAFGGVATRKRETGWPRLPESAVRRFRSRKPGPRDRRGWVQVGRYNGRTVALGATPVGNRLPTPPTETGPGPVLGSWSVRWRWTTEGCFRGQ